MEDAQERKVFKKCVDGIVCTVKGMAWAPWICKTSSQKLAIRSWDTQRRWKPGVLRSAYEHKREKNSCQWYRKSTDNMEILNFLSCAPLQHKKNVIQRTEIRILKATSAWQSFDVALRRYQEIWT